MALSWKMAGTQITLLRPDTLGAKQQNTMAGMKFISFEI